jgi:GTP pyrophosphokinase
VELANEPEELQSLLAEAAASRGDHDVDLIRRGYHFTELAHRGQMRKSGDPILSHLLAVTRILVEHQLDSTTLVAGLLHDTVEDAGIPLSQIRGEFGSEIAGLVDGMTRVKDLSFESPEVEQAENFRKMLLSMANDIRVVLIKFADRLHNMRTLEFLNPETRGRMAAECRDIYGPLAHRLGLARIRWELEDLSLKFLEPKTYRSIQEKISLKRGEREAFIEEVRKPLAEQLSEVGIHADITGRPKNFYSVYGKMERRQKTFEEIFDLFAVRIIVNTIPECYQALGIVHALHAPVMARFKDFIATPKTNMYQSLHTTVVGPGGYMVEVQIRTRDMHETSEVGIAAHWRYKEGMRKASNLDEKMPWLRRLVDWQNETSDPKDFIEELKTDLFPKEIYVFTPKGDLIQLPEESTPVDFAFAIHSDLGFRCTGARANGQIVPISAPLSTGSTVEVLTSPHQHPSRDWLHFVKSAKARSRIRHWLRETEHAQSIHVGEELMARELRRRKRRVPDKKLSEIAVEFGLADIEALYNGLGNGDISLNRVMNRVFPSARKKTVVRHPRTVGSTNPLRVRGVSNAMIHVARCCSPIPGEPILGLVTRGRGVSVHRRDCPNIQDLKADGDRILQVEWDTEGDKTFSVVLEVQGHDRPNFLRDITGTMSEMGVQVSGGELRSERGVVGDRFRVEVTNSSQLTQLIKAVRAVSGVTDIRRVDDPDES